MTKRFEIKEKIIIDHETNLMWERECVDSNCPWAIANGHANTLVLQGESGWRLPTIEELKTLMEFDKLKLTTQFPYMNSEIVWSSTQTSKEGYFLCVNFYEEEVAARHKDNFAFTHYVKTKE